MVRAELKIVEREPAGPDLETANRRMEEFHALVTAGGFRPHRGPLYAGVDLGTANIVTAVVDGEGNPVAGMLTKSRNTVRDGLVLDYVGAMDILRRQVRALRDLGLELDKAAAAYPPGTSGRNADSFGHVLESVGLSVVCLTDEPTAAAQVLEIEDGCVVDIGGGTTGISLLENGRVVYTADEATGGHHLDLVIAGNRGIELEEAEAIKNDPARQPELAHLVRPVFQKMATIVSNHLKRRSDVELFLVGGTCAFPGVVEVMETETGCPARLPAHPLLVTPLGIAVSAMRADKCESGGKRENEACKGRKFRTWFGK